MANRVGWRIDKTTPFKVRWTQLERFMSKVVEDANAQGCWGWTGPKISTGYSGFNAKMDGKVNGRWAKVGAHRWGYEAMVGPIPTGLHLDHLCRNTWCVNPAHLEPVTPRTNTLRGLGLAPINAAKTHCLRGHELTGDNLAHAAPNKRTCLTCWRSAKRNYNRFRRKYGRSPTRIESAAMLDEEFKCS